MSFQISLTPPKKINFFCKAAPMFHFHLSLIKPQLISHLYKLRTTRLNNLGNEFLDFYRVPRILPNTNLFPLPAFNFMLSPNLKNKVHFCFSPLPHISKPLQLFWSLSLKHMRAACAISSMGGAMCGQVGVGSIDKDPLFIHVWNLSPNLTPESLQYCPIHLAKV